MSWDSDQHRAVVTQYHLEEASEDHLWGLLNRLNIANREQAGLFDYTLTVYTQPDLYLQMYYTSNYEAGNLNIAALRIVLDQFLLEALPTPIDINRVCNGFPLGSVLFYFTDPSRTRLQSLTKQELGNIWLLLFRREMPYTQLHKHYNKSPQFYLDLYNFLSDNNEAVLRIIRDFNREQRPALTCRHVDRAYSTVLGAFFYSLYATVTSWDNISKPILCWK